MNSKELFHYINNIAEEKYKEKLALEKQRKYQQEQEDGHKKLMQKSIEIFFGKLHKDTLFKIRTKGYQVLSMYSFLKIGCIKSNVDDVFAIWLSDDYETDYYGAVNDLDIDNFSYDMMKALNDNKEKILLDIAKRYGYKEEGINEGDGDGHI